MTDQMVLVNLPEDYPVDRNGQIILQTEDQEKIKDVLSWSNTKKTYIFMKTINGEKSFGTVLSLTNDACEFRKSIFGENGCEVCSVQNAPVDTVALTDIASVCSTIDYSSR